MPEPCSHSSRESTPTAPRQPKSAGDKAPSAEDDQKIKDLEKASTEAREQQNKAIDDYAATAPRVAQMVDLALLGNGLLRGADLSRFIARSFELMA